MAERPSFALRARPRAPNRFLTFELASFDCESGIEPVAHTVTERKSCSPAVDATRQRSAGDASSCRITRTGPLYASPTWHSTTHLLVTATPAGPADRTRFPRASA